MTTNTSVISSVTHTAEIDGGIISSNEINSVSHTAEITQEQEVVAVISSSIITAEINVNQTTAEISTVEHIVEISGGPPGEPGASDWSELTGKPETFPPSSHTHDDRYYTETEIDSQMAGKADLSGGKVPSSQLPSYVDDVVEGATLASFPATGETGKIYVALDTGYTYRWSGSTYVQIGGGAPGGSSTSVQTNKNGALYGDDKLTYDDTNKILNLYDTLATEKLSTATLGSGWTQDATNYKKSANGTATLSLVTNSIYGEYYLLCIDVTGLTVGTATVTCAGRSLGTITANGLYKYKVRALGNGALVITPTNTARFNITKSILSLKKFTGGEFNVAGSGGFGDKVNITKVSNSYYADDNSHLDLNNPTGGYTTQVYRFGNTIKSAIQAASSGYLRMMTTDTNGLILEHGGSIGSTSPFAYISTGGLRMTQAGGYFYGKVSAGYAWSNLPSKLDVWGSEMKSARRVFTQNYTLDDDSLFVYDTSNASGCFGTPSTNCSSYGTNESNCNAHAEVGCSFVIQYYCSDFSWSNYGELSTCSNMGCNVVTASCSSASDSQSCSDLNAYGGNCAWNYNTQDCAPFGETECNNNTMNGCSVNTSNCVWTTYDCGQHTDATACGEHSGNGCTTNYFPCGDYNGNETGCNEQSANGCSYDVENSICTGGNFTSCTGGNGACGGGDPCTATDQSSCEMTTYFSYCSGSIAYYTCDGNYNTGECGGGGYGLCQGNASCNSLAQGRCNSTYNPGCNWENSLSVFLPNSTSFYTIFGTNDRAMTRVYEGVVYGGGTVSLKTLGDDKFENGSTTKTLANGKKYKKWFFAIKGDCSDFGSLETCQAQSGCSPTLDGEIFLNCSGEYLKYRRWFVSEAT